MNSCAASLLLNGPCIRQLVPVWLCIVEIRDSVEPWCETLARGQYGISHANNRGRIEPTAQLRQYGLCTNNSAPDRFTECRAEVFFIVLVLAITNGVGGVEIPIPA